MLDPETIGRRLNEMAASGNIDMDFLKTVQCSNGDWADLDRMGLTDEALMLLASAGNGGNDFKLTRPHPVAAESAPGSFTCATAAPALR